MTVSNDPFAFRIFTEIFVAKPEVNIHSKIQFLFYNPGQNYLREWFH